MDTFSQRTGFEQAKQVMQIEGMDDDLKNGLWNALTMYYWQRFDPSVSPSLKHYSELNLLIGRLYLDHFKRPVDRISQQWSDSMKFVRDQFFSRPWNKAYDFIEFVADTYPDKYVNETFMSYCNHILERELSGYRFVEGKLVRITSAEEIAAISEAVDWASRFQEGVHIHLAAALQHLSDRENPDYRNSIKESISAVEGMCQLFSGRPNASLGDALDVLERKGHLHPALKKAFDSLYGFTSDAKGIRHAMLEAPDLTFEDAKFMLVSCSAFVHYLAGKKQQQ